MNALVNILSTGTREEIEVFLDTLPDAFDALLNITISDKDPASWKAAWIIQHTIETNDTRLDDFIPEIINRMPLKKPGHQRELLKILLQLTIEEEYQSPVYEHCVSIWKNEKMPPGLRFTAMKMILQLGDNFREFALSIPELADDKYLVTLAAGTRRSIKKRFDAFFIRHELES